MHFILCGMSRSLAASDLDGGKEYDLPQKEYLPRHITGLKMEWNGRAPSWSVGSADDDDDDRNNVRLLNVRQRGV